MMSMIIEKSPPFAHDSKLNSRPWVLGQISTAITIHGQWISLDPV